MICVAIWKTPVVQRVNFILFWQTFEKLSATCKLIFLIKYES